MRQRLRDPGENHERGDRERVAGDRILNDGGEPDRGWKRNAKGCADPRSDGGRDQFPEDPFRRQPHERLYAHPGITLRDSPGNGKVVPAILLARVHQDAEKVIRRAWPAPRGTHFIDLRCGAGPCPAKISTLSRMAAQDRPGAATVRCLLNRFGQAMCSTSSAAPADSGSSHSRTQSKLELLPPEDCPDCT